MDKVILLSAIDKFFKGQPLSEEELDQFKQFFTSRAAFPDMPDSDKKVVWDTTVETINDSFTESVKNTVSYVLLTRYGIQ